MIDNIDPQRKLI